MSQSCRKKHCHYGKDDPSANCQLLSSNCPHRRLYSTTRIHGIVVEHAASADVQCFASAPPIAPVPSLWYRPFDSYFFGKGTHSWPGSFWAFWWSSPLH